MRLIGDLKNEKEAFRFSSFLKQEGINNHYEAYKDPQTQEVQYHLWIEDEDECFIALDWLNRFKEKPHDPQFRDREKEVTSQEKEKTRAFIPSFSLTHFIIAICALLFIWDGFEYETLETNSSYMAKEIGLTPVKTALLFDYPYFYQRVLEFFHTYPIKTFDEINTLPKEAQLLYNEINQIPVWKGFYSKVIEHEPQGPLFEKIRRGEAWRLFTPVLLHGDFLHILFNMAWLWLLGKQIEQRLGKWRMIFLILIIGIFANVAQYLMSGFMFIGFSGVIMGMVGFIWMRQKLAPWEGYPLHRSTIIFILIFIAVMFLLSLVSYGLSSISITSSSGQIGNTAHIVGGLIGLLLGRMRYFARGVA